MMSDAGYGLIMAIASALILWKVKPTGMFGKIIGVLALCGISTFGWGIVFGGWLGYELPALWFNPMEEPMTMLILCLGLGFVHVLTGLVTGAYINIKRKRLVDALCDQGCWIVLLLGLPMLIFGGILSTVGTYLALAGAAGLLLTAGRKKKGIIKKITGGLASLYGITSYLSDILSYSRIFGLGLATGVIAMVFNTISGMLAAKWYGIIFAAAVFLVGHVFNIAINRAGRLRACVQTAIYRIFQ